MLSGSGVYAGQRHDISDVRCCQPRQPGHGGPRPPLTRHDITARFDVMPLTSHNRPG